MGAVIGGGCGKIGKCFVRGSMDLGKDGGIVCRCWEVARVGCGCCEVFEELLVGLLEVGFK